MACRGCSSSDGCGCSVVGSGDGVITVSGSGTPIVSPYIPEFNGDVWLESLTEEADCDALNDPMVPVLQGDGSLRLTPLPCPADFIAAQAVPGNAFAFTFNTATTDSDPGDSTLKLNNATVSSVTQIFVDLAEFNGSTITAWLDSLDDATGTNKGRVRLYQRSNQAIWADFTLTGVTSATGYRKLVVTYVDHEGTFGTDPGDIVLDFTPSGNAGAAGATGATGPAGDWTTPQTIETVTGTYTLDIGDVGKYLRSTSASAYDLTVPTNASVAFSIGIHIDLIQAGSGQVTIVPAGGVTINANPGYKTAAQWGAVTLIKVGTDEWDLIGNLAA